MFQSEFPNRFLKWLKNPGGRFLSLDGFSEKLGIAFEHQGIQHYEYVKKFHGSKDSFRRHQEKDILKKKLCKRQGIKLAVVPDLVHIEGVLSGFQKNNGEIVMPTAILKACKRAGVPLPKGAADLRVDVRSLLHRNTLKIVDDLQEKAAKRSFHIDAGAHYLSDAVKLPATCDVCEHAWMISPQKIKQGRGCPKCARNLPVSEERVKQLVMGRRDLLIAGKIKNNRSIISLRCGECASPWKVRIANYLRGDGCPKYSGVQKKSQKDVKQKCLDAGWKLLSRYKNSHSTIQVACVICGSKRKCAPSNLFSKFKYSGCQVCKIKTSRLERLKSFVKYCETRNIRVLGTEFINVDTHILLECRGCNRKWEALPNNVLRGQGPSLRNETVR